MALWNARLKGAAAAHTVQEHAVAGRRAADEARCPRCEAELLLLSAEAFARMMSGKAQFRVVLTM